MSKHETASRTMRSTPLLATQTSNCVETYDETNTLSWTTDDCETKVPTSNSQEDEVNWHSKIWSQEEQENRSCSEVPTDAKFLELIKISQEERY